MTAWKRWQDYATMAFGVLLFISPFVFGETSSGVAAVSAYVLGVLLFLSGILAAINRESRRSLFVNAPGIAAVVTFVAALVIGIAGVTGIAWTAGVMAILTVAVAATLRFGRPTETKTA
jgi:uncharacterized membrane protein HdeD (DUF308 family)